MNTSRFQTGAISERFQQCAEFDPYLPVALRCAAEVLSRPVDPGAPKQMTKYLRYREMLATALMMPKPAAAFDVEGVPHFEAHSFFLGVSAAALECQAIIEAVDANAEGVAEIRAMRATLEGLKTHLVEFYSFCMTGTLAPWQSANAIGRGDIYKEF